MLKEVRDENDTESIEHNAKIQKAYVDKLQARDYKVHSSYLYPCEYEYDCVFMFVVCTLSP